MTKRSEHASRWLDVGNRHLVVPEPGLDGWAYSVFDSEIAPDADGRPGIGARGSRGRHVEVVPDLVNRFAQLAGCPEGTFPLAVRDFAKEHGLLSLCDHHKLIGHAPPCPFLSNGSARMHQWNSFESWRRYSRQVRGILGVIANLQVGETGNPDDWAAIGAGDPTGVTPADGLGDEALATWKCGAEPDFRFVAQILNGEMDTLISGSGGEPSALGREKAVIALVIQQWIWQSRAFFAVDWLQEEHYGRPHLRVQGLDAALAVGLAKAVQDDLFICGGCRNPSTNDGRGKRASRSGNRRSYCRSCGPGRRFAVAQQKRRQRKRQVGIRGTDSQTDSQPGGLNASDTEQ